MEENKAIGQEIWKILILNPKTSKGFYHHIKVLEKYNEQKVFYKKTVFSNFAIFTEKYMCTFFNKNADLQACHLIKNRLQHRCFLMSIVKFSRTPILKNICERLLLGFSFYISLNVFLHEQIISYKGGEEDIFSHKKQENHSIT